MRVCYPTSEVGASGKRATSDWLFASRRAVDYDSIARSPPDNFKAAASSSVTRYSSSAV